MDVLVSIIIPTYNCEAFIDECLDSVLEQLPNDYELVVVDDGSADNTPAIIASYEPRYCNLKAIYASHGGASSARNTGLDATCGKYVTFIDCDDTMKAGFIDKTRHLAEKGADMCIFGIERIPLKGDHEVWGVDDYTYSNTSDFADTYIRKRNLMIYSNCNKFYRKEIIDKLDLRFREGVAFGEDRVFNYDFLKGCALFGCPSDVSKEQIAFKAQDHSDYPEAGKRGLIITSEEIMISYIQRNLHSQSSKHVKNFFQHVMSLHEAKMDCMLKLSHGTTKKERARFKAYDLARETEITLERFLDHPCEIEENIPHINELVFTELNESATNIDVLIVMGSRCCDYKISKALEIGAANPGMIYIVSGGNPYKDDQHTEAEFMASYLTCQGVNSKQIYVENLAKCSKQNLVLSASILSRLRNAGHIIKRIGILTSGFHVPRTILFAKHTEEIASENIKFFAAYGPHTGKDNWYKNSIGKKIILDELKKTIQFKEMNSSEYRQ